MATNTPAPDNRSERVLAYMIASIIGLSVLCILAMLVASLVGAQVRDGVWPTIRFLPLIGIPFAVLLIIVRLVVGAVHRSRAAEDVE